MNTIDALDVWKTYLNNSINSGLGDYVIANDYNDNNLNYSNSLFPNVIKVASKAIASDLVGINPYYQKGIISYELAKILYEQCKFKDGTEYYFNDNGYTGYSLNYAYDYPNHKFVNNYYKDENWVGVNNRYAAPTFSDVLKWLEKDDNYVKYSSIVFKVKKYLYEGDNDKHRFESLSGPTGNLFYMDFKH